MKGGVSTSTRVLYTLGPPKVLPFFLPCVCLALPLPRLLFAIASSSSTPPSSCFSCRMESSSGGVDPLAHQEPVLYVLPLRIVAPPGVPSSLPPTFDPISFLNPPRPSSHSPAPAPVSAPDPPPSSAPAPPPASQQNSRKNDKPTNDAKVASKSKRQSAVRDFPAGSSKSGGPSAAPNDAETDDRPDLKNGKRPSERKSPKKPASSRKSPARSPAGVLPRRAVTSALCLFDAVRRHLVFEEEMMGKDSKISRTDLSAGTVLISKGLAVNRGTKFVGSVPGIEVGDPFFFRMEMCCVGMHTPIQAGIEYLTMKESQFNSIVATSIISSGGYDAKDDGEELIYTGQGGKPDEDQRLERGNLAMKGSLEHQVPIRVTRGIKDNGSPSGKTYTYDGLYKVEQYWLEKGKQGFKEFKFKLRRLPGQPDLGSANLKLSNSLKYKPKEREGLRVSDIANGKEGVAICVVNTVDNLDSPLPFDYSTSLHYSHEAACHQQFDKAQGCDCKDMCNASESCSCFVANGRSFTYLNCGVLVKERGVIYECGVNCKCSFSCRNRLTQRALKYRLEIFRTEDRGWGLRSWDTIPAGGFICEYTGILVQNLKPSHTRDYLLDTSRLPKCDPSWGDVSDIFNHEGSHVNHLAPRPNILIDASQAGNAARFINHSCSPNVITQCVLWDYHGRKSPHIMLFAMENIPPFRELTMDYGTKEPSSDSQCERKQCLCRSESCNQAFYQ